MVSQNQLIPTFREFLLPEVVEGCEPEERTASNRHGQKERCVRSRTEGGQEIERKGNGRPPSPGGSGFLYRQEAAMVAPQVSCIVAGVPRIVSPVGRGGVREGEEG
jgi:hypothetical protein